MDVEVVSVFTGAEHGTSDLCPDMTKENALDYSRAPGDLASGNCPLAWGAGSQIGTLN